MRRSRCPTCRSCGRSLLPPAVTESQRHTRVLERVSRSTMALGCSLQTAGGDMIPLTAEHSTPY